MTYNWKNIVGKLVKDSTEKEVSNKLGISISALHRLKSGKTYEPKYSTGEKILLLLINGESNDRPT